MDDKKRLEEPAVDRWSAAGEPLDERKHPGEVDLFSLSAGIMRPSSKTSNRIDGLLTKMMEHPNSGQYLASVDKNLDFLVTSLQLDMINISAETDSELREPKSPDVPRRTPKLELGASVHDDSD